MDFKEVYAQGLSSREIHAAQFSPYYNATTEKVMVVSHSGGVAWVSDPYGGHVSDDEMIVHHYPILAKYVPKGSIIFCDKGASHAAVVALAKAAGHDWRIPPLDVEDARARSTVDGHRTGQASQDVVYAHDKACREGRADAGWRQGHTGSTRSPRRGGARSDTQLGDAPAATRWTAK